MWKNAKECIKTLEQMKHNHSGLDSFKACMESLNNPQNQLNTIHVAGTNGKGSTVDFLRSILMQAGYRVATFTSPYLEVHNDRIRINNINISDDDFLRLANQTEPLWEKYGLSMFEIDMMIASLYFVEQQVDYAIFEVGLGGRIDATNILKHPLITIITNIGLDHTQLLGNTYAEIAQEKAKIMKPHVPCVQGSLREDCIAVFENEAMQLEAPFICVDEVSDIQSENGVSFIYQNQRYQCRSHAAYQAKNAACAIEVIHQLQKRNQVKCDETMIKKGLLATEWLGRFEIVHENPLVIIDGAHNEEGIQALVDSMKDYNDVKVIFSALKDKNSDKMIEKLFEISSDITICEFDFYRANQAENIAGNYPVKIDKDYRHAIETSLGKQGVILISGSLYFISLVREYFKKRV